MAIEEICNPTDEVIRRIKEMLLKQELRPGNKLPAERKLAEEIGVGRTHVRNALRKLEFYGIIKTYPQSGSVVAGLNVQALEGLITDVLKIDAYDFRSLVEMRIILEVQAARLCTANHTEEDMALVGEACNDFIAHFDDPLRVEKDFIFHRSLARGSHNQVLSSMLLIITPDILHYYHKHQVCHDYNEEVISEHLDIVDAIRRGDADEAEMFVRKHLSALDMFSKERFLAESVEATGR